MFLGNDPGSQYGVSSGELAGSIWSRFSLLAGSLALIVIWFSLHLRDGFCVNNGRDRVSEEVCQTRKFASRVAGGAFGFCVQRIMRNENPLAEW